MITISRISKKGTKICSDIDATKSDVRVDSFFLVRNGKCFDKITLFNLYMLTVWQLYSPITF